MMEKIHVKSLFVVLGRLSFDRFTKTLEIYERNGEGCPHTNCFYKL